MDRIFRLDCSMRIITKGGNGEGGNERKKSIYVTLCKCEENDNYIEGKKKHKEIILST